MGGEGGVGAVGTVGIAVFLVSVSAMGGVSGAFWVQELNTRTTVTRQTKTSHKTFFIFVPLSYFYYPERSPDTPKFSSFLETLSTAQV